MYKVEYDKSLVEHFPKLSSSAKAEISAIGACLCWDCNYVPCDDPALDPLYVCARFTNGLGAACWKISGWDGWQLYWYFEYDSSLTSTIETVVLCVDDKEPKTTML